MCVTTQTDLYLGVAHGWDIPAWWPLDASTWMLGIITLLGLPIIHGEMGSLLGTYCRQSPAETSHLASQFQVAVSVIVCLFQPRLICPVEVQRCHFGSADVCNNSD